MAAAACQTAPIGLLLRSPRFGCQHTFSSLRPPVRRLTSYSQRHQLRCQHGNGASISNSQGHESYTVTTPLYYVNAGVFKPTVSASAET